MNAKDESGEPDDAEMAIRMTHRDNRIPWILYPEDKIKNSWDLIITLVLLITCIQTPYAIAFAGSQVETNYFSLAIDIIFIFDILIIFNSAFYTEDMDIVDSRMEIGRSYFKGWFLIDSIAVVPFDVILESA